MKPSSVTRIVTIIFLKLFSYLYVKLLLAICKYRHTALPKQPDNSGNVLGLTFVVQCRNTPVIIAATAEDEQVWSRIANRPGDASPFSFKKLYLS